MSRTINRPGGVSRLASGGFTLLEVMVSLAIIAIALLAVYGNYSHTISMNIDQQFNTTAPLLAARVVADFENREPADLSDESGDFGPAFDGYQWAMAIEPVESEVLGNLAEDFYTFNIRVTFNDAANIYECKTLRFIRKEAAK